MDHRPAYCSKRYRTVRAAKRTSALRLLVPAIIVSPWTQGGWACSDVSDHTSCLKFLEVVTGVPSTGISAWRRNTVSDLTGAFVGPGYDPSPLVLPDTNGEVQLANYTTTLSLPSFPGADQTFPVQPKGYRRHTL
jgi:phospholipase C